MQRKIKVAEINEVLSTDRPFDSIIDVRSPSEFAEDHLPGSINLPVLTDLERSEVGTLYTQVDPFVARKRGAVLTSLNIAKHLEVFIEKSRIGDHWSIAGVEDNVPHPWSLSCTKSVGQ